MTDKTSHSPRRITTLVLLFPVLVLLLYGGLMYLYFAYAQSRDTRWEVAQYEDRLMDTEVSNLKEKVHNMAQYIRYYDSQSSNKIKKDIQGIVNVAVDVANGLYRSYHYTQSDPAIEAMIVYALEQIHFEGNIGYLFVLDMQGNVKLHRNPKRIGQNDWRIQDSNGKKIVQEFTKIVREKGEGYIDYYWHIPDLNDTSMHYKISFVKKIEGLDWYIGAGKYLHYMRQFIRKDMRKYIANNSRFDQGYFFVTTSKGETIFHPKGDAKTDAQTYLIEGVYRDDKHIAYTEYIAQYDWYITAVKDLDKVNASIHQNKEYILQRRTKNIHASLWIMFSMLLLSLLLSLHLSGVINRRLKNYEEQLKESGEQLLFQSRQALIGELLPMIAHQWRQPINKIASVLALMRFGLARGECDPAKIDADCAGIEESVEFMSETIDDFRTFYRPKNESEVADLGQLIAKAIEFVDGSIRKKDIHLSTHLQNIQYRLYANEFLQVMINLIKNAADASKQHGKIDIALFERDGAVHVVVTDDGEGIKEEETGKIFEPYFSTKENSMGLGLYMTKMIIEKHMHGTIEVQSTHGGGTRFTICLYRQV
jgi:signal transduction histidine kinase